MFFEERDDMLAEIKHRLEKKMAEHVKNRNEFCEEWDCNDVQWLVVENTRLRAVADAARALRAAKANTTEQGWGAYFKEMPALENLYQALAALDKET